MYTAIRKIIEAAWENRELLKKEETRSAIDQVIGLLDKGKLRTATPTDEGWQVNEWVKKAVILYFPTQPMSTMTTGPFEYHDKIRLKQDYAELGVPGGPAENEQRFIENDLAVHYYVRNLRHRGHVLGVQRHQRRCLPL